MVGPQAIYWAIWKAKIVFAVILNSPQGTCMTQGWR
jgi:hypothetical protein